VAELRSCALEVAPVHAEADPSSEQVTQALRGEPLTVHERRDGWARVTTAYDYPGWIAEVALAEEPPSHWLPAPRHERARDRLLGACPHGVAAARPARAA
jgi:hypothetical protein